MSEKIYQLVVVIINYKTPQLIFDCLESLLPELSGLDAKVVLVDNASNDNSCELIRNWIDKQAVAKQVDLIASDVNIGFSGGNNLGICHFRADYYLLLNSDTIIRKGAISLLLDAAVQDQFVGLVGPRLEWPDATPQKSCFRFHTPVSELISSSNTGPITRLFHQFNVPYAVSDKAGFYDWISFACVLVKSDVFKNTGLMDDGYFMYYEDVAFAYQAQQAGWKMLNIPEAHVVHLPGGSSPVTSLTKLRKQLPRYYYESRSRYFYQVYGLHGLFMANIFWTLGYGIALVRLLLSPSFKPNAVAYQWRDIWCNFFMPLKPYIRPEKYDKA